jgi:hypothetical protein
MGVYGEIVNVAPILLRARVMAAVEGGHDDCRTLRHAAHPPGPLIGLEWHSVMAVSFGLRMGADRCGLLHPAPHLSQGTFPFFKARILMLIPMSTVLGYQALVEGLAGLRTIEALRLRTDAQPNEPGCITPDTNSLCVRRAKGQFLPAAGRRMAQRSQSGGEMPRLAGGGETPPAPPAAEKAIIYQRANTEPNIKIAFLIQITETSKHNVHDRSNASQRRTAAEQNRLGRELSDSYRDLEALDTYSLVIALRFASSVMACGFKSDGLYRLSIIWSAVNRVSDAYLHLTIIT